MGVRIGPFCTVGPNVAIEDGATLVSHVVVDGHTRIGTGRDRCIRSAPSGCRRRI